MEARETTFEKMVNRRESNECRLKLLPVRRDNIYRSYQRILAPFAARHDEAGIEDLVAALARRAHHLQVILDPDQEPNPHIRTRLHRLRDWDATTIPPVVMLLLDRRQQGTTTTANHQHTPSPAPAETARS